MYAARIDLTCLTLCPLSSVFLFVVRQSCYFDLFKSVRLVTCMKEAERTLLFSEFVMNKSKKLIKPSEMLFIFTDFKL